jgi:hypothetical protein
MSDSTSASAASAAIPFKHEAPGEGPLPGAGWLAVVLLLCAAAGVMLHLLRRGARGAKGHGKAIEVVESRRLGERAQLSLVHYRGRAILIAHGEHGVAVLADDPHPRSEDGSA